MVWRHERGSALLEFALIIPLVFMLIFGIVDLGRWFNLHFTVSRIVYEGARYAAAARDLPEGKSEIRPGHALQRSPAHGKVLGRLQTLLDLNGLKKESAQVMVERVDPEGANYVLVQVAFPFTPYLGRLFGMSTALNSLTTCSARARAPYLFPVEKRGA